MNLRADCLQNQLEQLERLHSEIHTMITHTSDSHQIPSQNKTSKVTYFKKIAKNSNFEILQETWHMTHLLKLLDKMCKYKMDPTTTVCATEWTCDAGRTRDGRTDGVKPIYPPTTSLCGGNKSYGIKHQLIYFDKYKGFQDLRTHDQN